MKAHHFDESEYIHFCSPERFHTAVSTLLGTIEGICIDDIVDRHECEYLSHWMNENADLCNKAPLRDIIPGITEALRVGRIDHQSVLDIQWLLEQLVSDQYKAIITNDLMLLQGILGGITADCIVTQQELVSLQDWILDHDYLKGYWPYDEVDSLITQVLHDQVVDADEQRMLMSFFDQFCIIKHNNNGYTLSNSETITGICSSDPDIEFPNHRFCVTGHCNQHSRSEIEAIITSRGGTVTSTISKKLQYLVVGAERNQCWRYNCYGRKIEAAMQLRKAGHPIIIVHESDLLDATY